MIKRKLKQCSGKDHMAYIFSKGMCRDCWNARHGKKIPKVSESQKVVNSEFKISRDEFMSSRPYCQAKLNGCLKNSTDCHHKKHKKSKEDYINPEFFLAVCRSCHDRIHAEPEMAYEKGLLVKNL